MDRFLVFDIGAGSGRAIVGTLDENRISFEEIHRFDNRPVYAAGELYWDILRLFSEIKAGIGICTKKYGEVRSLAIDTWGCDFSFIDRSGRLIGNPVHYRDKKRYERAAKMHEILSEKELFMLSGGPQDKIMSIYQLFSLKYEKAVEYENAYKYLMVPDIMNYFLTGEVANEYTNATMSLMCNLTSRQWENRIITKLGFPESIFSHLAEPGVRLGTINKSVCDELGTSALTVVIPPTHDTASAIAGIPVENAGSEWGFLNLGTWCMSGIETQQPVIDEKVFNAGFGNEGGVEGKNMLLKNITGMWIIQQYREKWMRDSQKDISWEEINSATMQATQSSAYIDVDDARFGTVQQDMPAVIAGYCRQTDQKVPENMGGISNCFYESLVLKFRHNMNTLQELTGKKLENVYLLGGGVNNRLLCQWTADALGIPVTAGPPETTSVGNLIFQLKAGGFINTVQEGRKLCWESFGVKIYEPENISYWNDKYQDYIKLTNICS